MKKSVKLLSLLLLCLFINSILVSSSLDVTMSDQGSGVTDNIGNLLNDGNLTVTIHDSLSGGILIYTENFDYSIINGSWSVILGQTTTLSLEQNKMYYKDYSINGEDVSFVHNNGSDVDRQIFHSPLGDIQSGDLESSINLGNATGYLYSNVVGTPNLFNLSNFIADSALFSGDISVEGIIDTNITNCTEALETDGNGQIICGTDATGSGSSVWTEVSGTATYTGKVGIGNTNPSYKLDVAGNTMLSGNLDVSGTSTTLNSVVVTIEDPLISLGANNLANMIDVGWYGKYVESNTDRYTGIFRDASGNKMRFFTSTQVEPTTTVDITEPTYAKADVVVGDVDFTSGTMRGHMLPDTTNTYDLGSSSYNFRKAYIGPGGIFVNGKNIVQDDSGTITFLTDINQNLAVKTSGTGNLQITSTGTGDVEISSGGVIQVKDTLQILDGKKITSSGSTTVVVGNNLQAEGSLRGTSLTLDGVNSISAAELNVLDGVTAGTAIASKAVVPDENKDVSGIRTLNLEGDMITNITSCTEALETDGSGKIICGTDATGSGGGNGSSLWTNVSGTAYYPSNANVSGDLSFGSATMKGHMLPDTNAVYDIGSAEYKIRHLFLSDNSLWVGDTHKVSISDGKMKFRKRKTSTMPEAITLAGGVLGTALNLSEKASPENMTLIDWENYARTLVSLEDTDINDIFRDDTPTDWDEEFSSNAWLQNQLNDVYLGTTGNVGIGTDTPTAKLDVVVASGGAATIGADGNSATGNYAIAMGEDTNASGQASISIGYHTTASGASSTAMGGNTNASGFSSTAMGEGNTASGDYSTAMGEGTTASGLKSTAMGEGTTASGWYSTAMGEDTNASGNTATAMGRATTASGWYSTAMGRTTTASGDYSTTMGSLTDAPGDYSTAMGALTNASGYISTAMGTFTTASGEYSTAMGYDTTASGYYSTAMGYDTTASGSWSTAMGLNTNASGVYSTAMGWGNTAYGYASTAMGRGTTASGYASTAMGLSTTASGSRSTAMGRGTTASGFASTAMGLSTTASGDYSTAMGRDIEASGDYSVAIALNDQSGEIVSDANTMAIMGGEVGIGIYNPESLLHISSGTDGDAILFLQADTDNSNESDNPYILFGQDSQTLSNAKASIGKGQINPGSESNNLVLSNADGDIVFYTNGTTWQNAIERIRIDKVTGNVGIGNTNPNAKLDVNGDIEYTGSLTHISDIRLKENIKPIKNPIESLQEINGVTYNMIDSKEKELGVIAQDVQKVLPEIVNVVDEEKKYLGVDYTQLIPVLIEAVKEQQLQIEKQQQEIDELKTKICTGNKC